jgi:hypothetical protein
MNTRNRIFRASIPSVDVQVLEQEARRLRTAYQAEVLARLAVAIDRNVRCLAYRISAALGLGGTPCR